MRRLKVLERFCASKRTRGALGALCALQQTNVIRAVNSTDSGLHSALPPVAGRKKA
ncbi:hypothetical protein MES5069_860064 [Mesorhizobium escarrei]|uniref:Uncharacterized protein n=1 Tax=Mesorhizobium escarrei TaxID=666018 RepID=A0ABM9EJ83_9HYPH|nr:hypothetical protein MES5069_860064 [Mesorhizobium escarrei]